MIEAHQFVTALSYGDAIGDYTLEIQRILRKNGYQSEIYSEVVDPRMTKHVVSLYEYELRAREDILMLIHFSIGSDLGDVIPYYKGKKMLIYHNITPYEWFKDVSKVLAHQCFLGRQQLQVLKDFCPLGIGVSENNRKELEELGFAATGVLPIQTDFAKFDAPSDLLTTLEYDDQRTNIVVVGRTSPNKNLEDCLKIFACYQKYLNPLSRLIIVGWRDGFTPYYLALRRMVNELELQEVIFTGHVGFDELLAYYRIADTLLIMSRHEGFCVPILEAFYLNVPVIALDRCAIPDTAGPGGILIEQTDYMAIAEMLHKICTEEDVRQKLIASQQEQIKTQQGFPFEQTLLKYLDQLQQTKSLSLNPTDRLSTPLQTNPT